MGKVVKFVGRYTGLIGGFITDGTDGALASLKFSLALMSGNPFLIGAVVAQDFATTFLTKGAGKGNGTTAPVVFRQAVSDSFIVYGERRVGGLMVFFHSRKSSGKHYRYFVIACAGHRCQGVLKWMLNDEEVTVDGSGKVTSGTYANKAWLWFGRGTSSETANSTFVSECDGKWTSAHKGNGVAKIYAKFEMSDDVINAGMPNITAVIEGKDDIFDPRDDSTGYSRNATLCAYDWMETPREEGGFGAFADEIPDADYISAQANVCDEDVDGEPRYAVDAVIGTGSTPSAVRDTFMLNCAGSYTYSGGKHLLRPGYYVPVSETLSESDFNGPIQVSAFLAADSTVNEVQGTYVDPASGYQSAAFATQTANPAPDDIRQGNLELAFTTSKNQGERIAGIAVRRGQHELTVTCPMNIAGLKVSALDTVAIDTARYGLDGYEFQVTGWSLSTDMSIIVTLREESADIYDPPEPVTPDTVPTIDAPAPLDTTINVTGLIGNSSTIPTVIASADESSITIEDHVRRYLDKEVNVSGASLTEDANGDPISDEVTYGLAYDDPDREGGAVTWAAYPAATRSADAYPSPDNPFRHQSGFITTDVIGGSGVTGGGSYSPGSAIGGEVLP